DRADRPAELCAQRVDQYARSGPEPGRRNDRHERHRSHPPGAMDAGPRRRGGTGRVPGHRHELYLRQPSRAGPVARTPLSKEKLPRSDVQGQRPDDDEPTVDREPSVDPEPPAAVLRVIHQARTPSTPTAVPTISETAIRTAWTHRKLVGSPCPIW